MLYDQFLALIAGIVVLASLLATKVLPPDANAILVTAIIVTNIIYEFLLMFLLGFGLVEFPRNLWIQSNTESSLKIYQMTAAKEFADIADKQLDISLIISNILKTKAEVN